MEESKTPILDIGLLDLSELEFYKNKNGFLAMRKGEQDYKRVRLTRAVPLTDPFSYVAVSDAEGKEIGIMKTLDGLPEGQRELVGAELDGCYYCPIIEEIFSIREKLGYFYFDVRLKETKRLFAVKDISRSIKQLDDGGIIINDVDGNRFIIADVETIKPKSRRKLEPYLY